ncbi:MAG: LysE family transporter [Burkholderiaceae bacterium]
MRGGLAATLGMMVGDQILLWLRAGRRGGAAARVYPMAFSALQWVGAASIWLGWASACAHASRRWTAPALTIKPRHYFQQAFLITLFNPKAIVFYVAFLPLFIDPGAPAGPADLCRHGGHLAVLTFAAA